MLRPVKIYEIVSPCKRCPGDSPDCRATCPELDALILEMDQCITYGAADSADDFEYRLLPK